MVNRIDVDGNEANTVTIARQFAHFAEQNLRQIADGGSPRRGSTSPVSRRSLCQSFSRPRFMARS